MSYSYDLKGCLFKWLLTLEVVLAGVAEVFDVAGQAGLVADNEVRGGEIGAWKVDKIMEQLNRQLSASTNCHVYFSDLKLRSI